MKQIKLISVLLFFSGLMVLYNGCKDKCPLEDPTNPDCDSYDPCYSNRINNTHFRVKDGNNGFAPLGDWCQLRATDTLFSSIILEAPEGNHPDAVYKWQIGSEENPRYGKSFEISFSNYLRRNGNRAEIPITLTINIPMNSCLQNESEMEKSSTRVITFLPNRNFTYIYSANEKKTANYTCKMLEAPYERFNLSMMPVSAKNYESIKDGGSPMVFIGLPYMNDTLFIPIGDYQKNCINSIHDKILYNVWHDNIFRTRSYGLKEMDIFYKQDSLYLIRQRFENLGVKFTKEFEARLIEKL